MKIVSGVEAWEMKIVSGVEDGKRMREKIKEIKDREDEEGGGVAGRRKKEEDGKQMKLEVLVFFNWVYNRQHYRCAIKY